MSQNSTTQGVKSRTMRIGYFGDGAWANRALETIVADDRFTVSSITTRFTNEDQELRAWASRLNVPYLPTPNVNSDNFLKDLMDCGPEILVSMSYDQIFRARLIDATPHGIINCHAGALPFYRGRNPLNWALINGEHSFGITVHFIDEGIDTGDVILQRLIPIGTEDTYADLLHRAHDQCASALLDALIIIKEDRLLRRAQITRGRGYTYFSSRRSGDEWIDWSWTSRDIHNFVRAISPPGPCARTLVKRTPIAIVRSDILTDIPAHIGTPGEVVGRDPSGIYVKTGDTVLKVTQIATFRSDGSLGTTDTPTYPLGTRLGTRLLEEFIALRQEVDKLQEQINKIKPSSED